MSEEADLFDSSEDGSGSHADRVLIEDRLDAFAELGKESTQVAGKLRTQLNALTESARLGSVVGSQSQIARLAAGVSDLRVLVERLVDEEQSLGLRGGGALYSNLTNEIRSALAKRGVDVVEGPKPYWLAYPAWFKVQRTAKGNLEVILNGDRLDTQRPSAVAAKVAEVASEKFDAKQFTDLLLNVRQLFRRAGASADTLLLDDIFDALAMEPVRRVARRKDFTRGSFYYSVHRLAQHLDRLPEAIMEFPTANRPDNMFFDDRGETRKYLTVKFAERPSL